MVGKNVLISGARWGLFIRNQVIRTFAMPGLARAVVGRDITDRLQLPDYEWPALASASASPTSGITRAKRQ